MTDFSLLPPASDILEISLFGCGVGEALLIHVGNNEWVVVDSCRHPDSRMPVALDYLRELGVDPSAIKLLLITHWHNDHVGGIADLAVCCPAAEIAFPGAMTKIEFVTLMASFSVGAGQIDRSRSGLSEMIKVFDILKADRDEKRPSRLKFAQQDGILYRGAHSHRTQLVALSPSPEAMLASLSNFAALKNGVDRCVLVTPEQNHNAVALWVQFGGQRVLLGSDLEEYPGQANLGWSGVLRSTFFPDGQATLFKVPHHGSQNAHHHDVWNQLVVPKGSSQHAIMTTFNRGTTPLPRDTDVSRIKGFTDNLHCTTVPKVALPRRDATVERAMREAVVPGSRVSLRKSYGHIRYRLDINGNIDFSQRGTVVKL